MRDLADDHAAYKVKAFSTVAGGFGDSSQSLVAPLQYLGLDCCTRPQFPPELVNHPKDLALRGVSEHVLTDFLQLDLSLFG